MNPQCSTSFALGSVRACIPQGHFDAEAAAVGTVLIGRGADPRNVVSRSYSIPCFSVSTKMYADAHKHTHTHLAHAHSHTPTCVCISMYIYIFYICISRERESERRNALHTCTHTHIYICPPSLFACLPIQDTAFHRQGYIETLIYYLYVRIHGREGGSNRQTHTHTYIHSGIDR